MNLKFNCPICLQLKDIKIERTYLSNSFSITIECKSCSYNIKEEFSIFDVKHDNDIVKFLEIMKLNILRFYQETYQPYQLTNHWGD